MKTIVCFYDCNIYLSLRIYLRFLTDASWNEIENKFTHFKKKFPIVENNSSTSIINSWRPRLNFRKSGSSFIYSRNVVIYFWHSSIYSRRSGIILYILYNRKFILYAREFIFDFREFILEIWDFIPYVRQFNLYLQQIILNGQKFILDFRELFFTIENLSLALSNLFAMLEKSLSILGNLFVPTSNKIVIYLQNNDCSDGFA